MTDDLVRDEGGATKRVSAMCVSEGGAETISSVSVAVSGHYEALVVEAGHFEASIFRPEEVFGRDEYVVEFDWGGSAVVLAGVSRCIARSRLV